ncbi:hypothetical protein E3N88_19664 [Mikania micrantha]|uniref:F-box domain-containing protein n=1 Tax=Mikania micrantha TaxID=192012 RepID=A0A5N6NRM1_9ASTR|nr:hypothetical protein E3N88_19664 [Mikania micrantha]
MYMPYECIPVPCGHSIFHYEADSNIEPATTPVEVSPEEIRDQVVDDENVTVVPSPMTAAVDRLLKTMTGMDACPSEVLLRKSLKKMNAPKYRSLNGISNLPENVFESILTLMPIKDALRTSVLLKKWRYSWRSMPKLVFTSNMVKVPSDCGCGQLKKYKLVNAIFHVLLLHNGPSILEFDFSNNELQMDSEFDQILSHLSKGNNVKELALISFYHLPISFYSLQGLERIHLENCDFEPILTFNGFSRLRKMVFINVGISARMLQHFLSNCPLLEEVILRDYGGLDFAGEIKFTFVEFLQCVPLIKTLEISQYPMKVLLAGAMPHELPTSLDHLKHLQLDMCIMEQDEISSALCMIRSSPVLEKMVLLMYNKKLPVRQIPNNFLDLENYSDLKLGHLETLEIEMSRKSPLVMDFVKLVMAKAPVLKKVRIQLRGGVSVDDELKMLRGLIRLPFRRASPYAKFIVERYKASE